MTDEPNVSVAAPEKWMDGWDKIYTQMLEMSDEELTELSVRRPITQLIHAMRITETDPEGLRVLELACGDGEVACYLGKLGCRVEGVEALVNAIKVAKRRIKILGLEDNVSVRIGDIDGWDIEPESYDVISIIQALQYLFDRTLPRLREILAGIKPGGYFVYSGNILPHFETDPPIRFITEDELKTELSGWTLHCFGGDETLQKPGDLRGYVWTVARKPL